MNSQWVVREQSIDCPWAVPGLSMNSPWDWLRTVHRLYCARIVRGHVLGCLCTVHGLATNSP
eukprot:5246380-Lingulodinium_polyedra.AAC.1